MPGNAESLGGACTYNFSQGQAFKVRQSLEHISNSHVKGKWKDQGKMYKMVLRGVPGAQKEMGGVCATLAAFWIAFHSSQDSGAGKSFTKGRSVWDYLFEDNGLMLNMGAAMNIVVEHHQSSGNQLNYLETFLKKFGITKRTSSMSGAAIVPYFQPFTSGTTHLCADMITRNNGYKLIQLKKTTTGAGGGHMVAAWSDGSDVLFMDPNFGEFWLPNAGAFKTWLAGFFADTYQDRYKSMRVHNYVYKG